MENKINYQKMLLETIEKLKKKNKRPKLLLHVCCGPCSTACIDILNESFDITVLFFNPNIHPQGEYEKRFNEMIKFLNIKNEHVKHKIEVLNCEYNPKEYFEYVKGFENEEEGGKRCEKCFYLRLENTAKIAKQNGFDCFTTTLSVSPYKNSQLLNQIGKEVAQKYDIDYLFSDFKKNEGYKKSIQLSKQYELYRQDYCGCIYSLNERNKYFENKKEQE